MTQITPPNFTQIPNVVFDYWMPRLKPAEACILLILCRKIFGWHKTSDTISANRLIKATGLSKPTILAALKTLEEKGLVTKTQSVGQWGNLPNEYSLNISVPVDELYTDHDLEKMKKADPERKILGGGSQNPLPGVVKEFDQGVVKNLYPQNKDLSKERLTKEKEDIPDSANASPASSPPSVLLAENVRVTESENTSLLKQLPPELKHVAPEMTPAQFLDLRVKALSEWKIQNPAGAKKRKCDFTTLNGWVKKKVIKDLVEAYEMKQRIDRIVRVEAEAKPVSKSRDKSLEHVQRKKITVGGSE